MARKKRAVRSRSRSRNLKVSNSSSTYERKRKLVIKNIFAFAILFVLSLGLYYVSPNGGVFYYFFWILSIVTGFVLLAFIIAYLILFFIKAFRN